MYYREFREEMLHLMREQAGEKIKISLTDKQKLNGKQRWGLLMEQEGCVCSPVIYLEDSFKNFQQGMAMEKIADKLWMIYEEETKDTISLLKGNISDMESFEGAAEKLFMRIFHREQNEKLLEQTPFVPVLDLAMTAYYLVQGADAGIRGTIMITNEHLQDWGVTKETVFERAMSNSLEKDGIYWNAIEEVMDRHEMLSFPEPLPHSHIGLHVLTNRTGVWGAVMAFLPGVAKRLYEAIGEEYYLLPSSIHEVLFIPAHRAADLQLLQRTVRDVNRHEVSLEERLSDHVYYYHSGEDRLEIAGLQTGTGSVQF
ncbi:MAG: DUF5688 family protein [Lachnospiraceae bacterium]|nr:DUF5688 family protein [Lachnospiraceae bacterium]